MEAVHAPESTARNYPGTIYGVWVEPGSHVEWYKTFLPDGSYAITGYSVTQPVKDRKYLDF